MAADKGRDDNRRTTPPPGLEELLADMRELRLTFAADLTSAAGAAEAGADDVVADIVVGDQRELAAFSRRSRARLAALSNSLSLGSAGATAYPGESDGMGRQPEPIGAGPVATSPGPRSHWRRRALVALPAVPLAGALAVSAAAATGLLPLPTHHDARPSTSAPEAAAVEAAPATSTFHDFETLLRSDPSASEVVAAATALHHQLEKLIAAAPTDPAGASEVAKLLKMEQALLIRTKAPGSATVLAASRKLAAQLVVVVSASKLPSSVPTPVDVQSSPHPHRSAGTHPRPSSSATPPGAPNTSPSSAPTPAPTSTSSPSPSPSSSDGVGHLPTLGN